MGIQKGEQQAGVWVDQKACLSSLADTPRPGRCAAEGFDKPQGELIASQMEREQGWSLSLEEWIFLIKA